MKLCKIGFSVYVSSFNKQKAMIETMRGKDIFIFTSFHFQEEWNDAYKEATYEMLRWLKNNKFKVCADVSKKTLDLFKYVSMEEFLKDYPVDYLRIDYGFSDSEIISLSENISIVVNASTLTEDSLNQFHNIKNVIACHNFYPRPETGLAVETFLEINQAIQSKKIPVIAFVPGDKNLRGPLHCGLPTLEKHRNRSPYISFVEMLVKFKVDCVLIGDLAISEKEKNMISSFVEDQVIILPVDLKDAYEHLYNELLTIRIDSGAYAFRIQESREYSCKNNVVIAPENCLTRMRGVITIDNSNYKRYVGEIQIVHQDLPVDKKVNVIGRIQGEYLDLLDLVKGNSKIRFVRS